MEIKKSELSLKGFSILNSSFSSTEEKNNVNFEDYKIEIDFRVSGKSKYETFENLMMLNINSMENPLDGYSFSIVALGKFKIDDIDSHPQEKVNNLVFRSSVPMMIANLRAYLFSLTSYGKFGIYSLPSIDVMDLLTKHSQALERKNENKLEPASLKSLNSNNQVTENKLL